MKKKKDTKTFIEWLGKEDYQYITRWTIWYLNGNSDSLIGEHIDISKEKLVAHINWLHNLYGYGIDNTEEENEKLKAIEEKVIKQ